MRESDPLGLHVLSDEELVNLQDLWAERLLLISQEVARRRHTEVEAVVGQALARAG